MPTRGLVFDENPMPSVLAREVPLNNGEAS
jgi:hypothetical protein